VLHHKLPLIVVQPVLRIAAVSSMSMIRKSGYRFSEKIILKQQAKAK
jgi:hypothetical protein